MFIKFGSPSLGVGWVESRLTGIRGEQMVTMMVTTVAVTTEHGL